MEVLFFIIFGGLFCLFVGYGIKLHREDKKILRDYEDQEKKSQISYKAEGRILGWGDIPGGEMDFLDSERPFVDCYKSAN